MAKDDLFGDEGDMVRMTFGEHLEDLRRRLILSMFGFIPGVVIGLCIGGWLVDKITRPVKAALVEFYDARRVTKLAELEKKKLTGQEIRHEELLLRVRRDTLRDVLRKAFPNLELPDETADQASAAPHHGDANQARPDEAAPIQSGRTTPDTKTTDGAETIEFPVEIAHDELVYKSQLDLYPGAGMMTLNVQEGFMAYMKVSIVAGLVLSSWWVIFQLWQFVAEGLYKNERKVVYRAMPLSAGLFLVGVVFCFFVVLPVVLTFFFGFNKWLGIEPNIRLSEWLGFATVLPIIFGICFELPLVMMVLEQVGIFKLDDYMSKWRHAILIISIIAMVVTPTTDPGSMMLLMGPMTALYGLGLAMVYMRHVKKGDVPPLSRVAKLRLVMGFLATVYAIGVLSGFMIPAKHVDQEWWFEQVWKPGTLPASYVVKSQLSKRDPSWIFGATLANTTLLVWVFFKLGSRLLRLSKDNEKK